MLNRCAVPTCYDGVQNGQETDVDCGGFCPMSCETNKKCTLNEHCISMVPYHTRYVMHKKYVILQDVMIPEPHHQKLINI